MQQRDLKELQLRAYAQGVQDVVSLALKAAEAMPASDLHATRHGFASAALEALALEAAALIPTPVKEQDDGQQA